MILRESTNGACFILGGYFRRSDTSVYTTALIKRKLFTSHCGEWYPGDTIFDNHIIVFTNYERIASALLASIRDIFPGQMRALPPPYVIDIKAIIMSELPLPSGQVTTMY